MRGTFSIAFSVLAAASVWGASLPTNAVRGEYIEARTADVYTGPCFANSEVGVTGDLAVMGWKIEKGEWQGVSLDGLSVMGVLRASGTLGDVTGPVYPVKSVLIVDDRASAEQRLALKSFARKMGGDLLNDIVHVEYQRITFSMEEGSVHSRRLTMAAGVMAKIETRPLAETDQICHNEEVWYQPLTPVDHAMAAYTVAHDFHGTGLGTTWSSPSKRSAFVANFHYTE